MGKEIHIGVFDSESYWRNDSLAKLPSMEDKERRYIIMAMDELLFPMLKEGDRLITRYKTDDAIKDYLRSVGFNFTSNDLGVVDREESIISNKCIFQILSEDKKKFSDYKWLSKKETLSPYSVIPYTTVMCEKYDLKKNIPESNAVVKVNSKAFSYNLNTKLGIPNKGVIVNSSEELEVQGRKFLEAGYLLIKDIYGVSGKGNMLINSQNIFQRVVRYIQKQVDDSKEVQFILEPLFVKELDFSCQFKIEEDGTYHFISVQKLDNNSFAFRGSYTAEDEFVNFLGENGYFAIMEKVSQELFREGYFGNVCIDSLLLENGEIIPILEINARKSMGLLNYYIDKHLSKYSLSGKFTYFSIGYPKTSNFQKLLEAIKARGLLFECGSEEGIIPMSSNTIFINSIQDYNADTGESKIYKGRIYFSAVGCDNSRKDALINKIKELLLHNEFKVYN